MAPGSKVTALLRNIARQTKGSPISRPKYHRDKQRGCDNGILAHRLCPTRTAGSTLLFRIGGFDSEAHLHPEETVQPARAPDRHVQWVLPGRICMKCRLGVC